MAPRSVDKEKQKRLRPKGMQKKEAKMPSGF